MEITHMVLNFPLSHFMTNSSEGRNAWGSVVYGSKVSKVLNFFYYHFNSHKVLQLRINHTECRKIGFTA